MLPISGARRRPLESLNRVHLNARSYKRKYRKKGLRVFIDGFSREDIAIRDNHTCYMCGAHLESFEIDHVIPISRVGFHTLDNVSVSCQRCNSNKKARMPWELDSTLQNIIFNRLVELKHQPRVASLVIAGPMFSKKSTRLLEMATLYNWLGYKVACFKPSIDDRYALNSITTHDGLSIVAMPVTNTQEILDNTESTDVIFIDEVQFFDKDIIKVVNELRSAGKFVVSAGLNSDFMGSPFEITGGLAMLSDKIIVAKSQCARCKESAMWTQMVVGGMEVVSGQRVHVGGPETYEPRCSDCFVRS